jgi:uncharacterized membrane protein
MRARLLPWLREKLLASVSDRHVVLTIPRLLRSLFPEKSDSDRMDRLFRGLGLPIVLWLAIGLAVDNWARRRPPPPPESLNFARESP